MDISRLANCWASLHASLGKAIPLSYLNSLLWKGVCNNHFWFSWWLIETLLVKFSPKMNSDLFQCSLFSTKLYTSNPSRKKSKEMLWVLWSQSLHREFQKQGMGECWHTNIYLCPISIYWKLLNISDEENAVSVNFEKFQDWCGKLNDFSANVHSLPSAPTSLGGMFSLCCG